MRDSPEQSAADLVRFAAAQRRIAVLVAHGATGARVLDAVATELGRLIDADAANIVRYENDGSATVVATWGVPDAPIRVGTTMPLDDGRSVSRIISDTGRPARMDSYTAVPGSLAALLRRQGIRSTVGAPIVVEGRLWGVVTASATRDELLAADAEARLADYTDLIAIAIANAQARMDLAASRVRVVVAADQARRRIERNLHDGVHQQLIAIAIGVGDTRASVPPEMPQLRGRLSELTSMLTGVVDELREISRGIHPTILSDRGLQPALKGLARRCAIPVELDLHLDVRLPEPVEVAAYDIVAEALTNAAKHARASHVRVEAMVHDAHLHLAMRDDGVGGADAKRGFGLLGLMDRVDALGGSITISSPPGRGTHLQAKLPIERRYWALDLGLLPTFETAMSEAVYQTPE